MADLPLFILADLHHAFGFVSMKQNVWVTHQFQTLPQVIVAYFPQGEPLSLAINFVNSSSKIGHYFTYLDSQCKKRKKYKIYDYVSVG